MRRPAVIRAIAGLVIVAVTMLFAACGSHASKAGGSVESGATLRLHGSQTAFAPGPTFGKPPFEEWSFTSALTDAHGRSVGHAETSCTTSPRKNTQNCSETLVLKAGQIVAEGVTSMGHMSTLAVIGGTGSYEGARGSLRTTGATARGEDILVHLLGTQ